MCGAGAHQVLAQELTRVRHAGRPNEGRASLAGQRAHIEAWRPATSRKVASAHVRDHPLVVCGGARAHRARIPTLVAFWRLAHDRRACPFRATTAVCTRRLGRPDGISAVRARGSIPRGGTAAGPPPRGSRRRRAAHPAAGANGPVCTPPPPEPPTKTSRCPCRTPYRPPRLVRPHRHSQTARSARCQVPTAAHDCAQRLPRDRALFGCACAALAAAPILATPNSVPSEGVPRPPQPSRSLSGRRAGRRLAPRSPSPTLHGTLVPPVPPSRSPPSRRRATVYPPDAHKAPLLVIRTISSVALPKVAPAGAPIAASTHPAHLAPASHHLLPISQPPATPTQVPMERQHHQNQQHRRSGASAGSTRAPARCSSRPRPSPTRLELAGW